MYTIITLRIHLFKQYELINVVQKLLDILPKLTEIGYGTVTNSVKLRSGLKFGL